MDDIFLKTKSLNANPQTQIIRPGMTLGRSRESNVVLRDETASREQCTFDYRAGAWFLVNLSKSNQTRLNGEIITEHPIEAGDHFTCGTIEFEVLASDDSSAHSRRIVADDLTRTMPRTQLIQKVSKKSPDSTDVFAKLLDSNHELLASKTITELVDTLNTQLQDLFDPGYVMIKFIAGSEPTIVGNGDPIPLSHSFDDLLNYSGEKDQTLCITENQTLTLVSAPSDIMGIHILLQRESSTSEADAIFLDVLNCVSTMCNQISGTLFSNLNDSTTQDATIEEIGNDLILIGDEKLVQELKSHLRATASSDSHVLIQGETGVGKEVISKMIHGYSKRKAEPIKIINCAAIPTELFESEMFGHEKDAFTGATTSRMGAFESTHLGTLVLDEVTELSLDQQAKLLRAIEHGAIQRIGHDEIIEVDVRIVSITNQIITDLVEAGRFRSDLYYRLTGSSLSILPLRERKVDIAPLVKYFLFRSNLAHQKSVLKLTADATQALMTYDWPGNVRELKNVIHRAVSQSEGSFLGPENLYLGSVPTPAPRDPGLNLPVTSLKEMEVIYAKYVYDYCEGDIDRAAEILGIGTSTLYKKLKH